jgi:hypothetical protein
MTPRSEQVVAYITPEIRKALDDERRKRPEIPSMSDLVCEILERWAKKSKGGAK